MMATIVAVTMGVTDDAGDDGVGDTSRKLAAHRSTKSSL